MYIRYAGYLPNMEAVTVMGIMELRSRLGERIEAAFFHNEPTVVKHEKRNQPRAALVPYEWLIELQERRARDADS